MNTLSLRLFTSTIIALVVIALLPVMALAEAEPTLYGEAEPDMYANEVYNSGANLYQPNNALGEPDSSYASFFAKDAVVTYDMGEGEEGDGDLILHMQLLNFGAAVRVEFYSESMEELDEVGYIFYIGDAAVTIPYDGDGSYRYVKLTSVEDETWNLDAVELTSIATETDVPVEEEPVEEDTTEEAEEESTAPQGLMVKLVDDGNPDTTVDAAVYIIGADDKRHAFPNELVFNSWGLSFDEVAYIDPVNLANYQLGDNVTMRPGTWLVKITTDPKVYAVEPGGILRWVSTEEIAIELYGEDWADRVVDVSDVFFGNYTMGDPIETAIHPSGTLGITPAGEVVYIHNSSYYGTGYVYTMMRFIGNFATYFLEDTFDMYIDAGDLGEDASIMWPY